MISQIGSYSRQLKHVLMKQTENIRQLHRQSERLQQEANNSTVRNHSNQTVLKNQVMDLQEEIAKLTEDKDKQVNNLTLTIQELNNRI